MTLRGSIDRQVASICALAESVNYDMAGTTIDEKAIEVILAFPPALNLTPGHKLPALNVWRMNDRREMVGNRTKQVAKIGLAYTLPATPRDEYEARWATLQDVWSRLSATILRGSHESVCGGENVLSAADVEKVDEMSPTVSYLLDPQESATYPGFVGEITVIHKTIEEIAKLADRDRLPDLIDLYAHYRIDPDSGADDVAEIIAASGD